ncbi:MAG: glycoside hydrolase family 31 protein [Firmicutes bacterium]|nr:glycoside hydrolase family 31 protein [Bacillota bacterium]
MIKRTAYGYTIENDNNFLDIVFYGDNIVRFVYSKENRLPGSTSAVVAKPKEVELELENNIIKSNKIKIVVNEKDLKVKIYDTEGNLLNKDKKIDVDNVELHKEIIWEKGFYGMGEKYGWINRLGESTVNWNSDVIGLNYLHNPTIKKYHTSIPFYIGLDTFKTYGIYFDNTYETKFDFGKYESSVQFSSEGGNLDYYFIYGDNVSDVIKGYSKLTGTMPLPRKDFLGYQQCRWSYENREQLMEVASKMREENIPCDVLYLDIDYMKDYKVFTVDSDKFKEFKKMNTKLKKMGYKLVVIIDPGVKKEKGYDVYEQGLKKDYYIKDSKNLVYVGEVWPGDAVFPDFLREDVRKWWGELHKDLVKDGVEGIWNDMNEPSDFSTESKTLPKDCLHVDDKGKEKTHSEIHNIYGMLEAKATYNGLKNINDNKRPFILTRAAFSGTQRYAALWTGDNTSIWEHLESSIPMYLNLSLSGFSFIGGDVGGFLEDSNGELLTRWTQLGAFTPLFRNHSAKGTINQEPWSFDDETLKNTVKYIKLRYNFITYMYNLMRESSKEGEPALRPLFYHYQNDENTFNINDQFLLGEKLMICPITRPAKYVRMIYLPKGVWYDYWTKEKITGGRYIIKEAKLDVLPMYVKAGAILPKDTCMNYIGEKDEKLDIEIYAGENNEYNIYFDDGLSFDYKDGVYSEILIKLQEDKENINIETNILKDKYNIPEYNFKVYGNDDKDIIINDKRE